MGKLEREIQEHLDNAVEADITLQFERATETITQLNVTYIITFSDESTVQYKRALNDRRGDYPMQKRDVDRHIRSCMRNADCTLHLHVRGFVMYGEWDATYEGEYLEDLTI